MLFADLLSLHLATFLKFFILVERCFFHKSEASSENQKISFEEVDLRLLVQNIEFVHEYVSERFLELCLLPFQSFN